MRPSKLLFLFFGIPTTAHMWLSSPPALKAKNNPYAGTDIDYSLTTPLSSANYPCKGYLTLLGTPGGTPVATWTAGSTQRFTISGGAPHAGGSCQASLSIDGGNTFHVLHSYVGGCPLSDGASFEFTVPGDTPSSEAAVFSWTWFNNLGNREMYQNCAVVRIQGGGGGGGDFNSRPAIFKANLGDGCTTVESKELLFPDPGRDVTVANAAAVPPVGTCAGGRGGAAIVQPPPAQLPPGGGAGGSGGGNGGGGGADPGNGAGVGGDDDGDGDHHEGESGGGDDGGMGGPGEPSVGDFQPGNDWPEWFHPGNSGSFANQERKAPKLAVVTGFVAVAMFGLLG